MGPFLGGIITFIVIIVGLIQTLAPVFKSIKESIEKSKGQPSRNPVRPEGMNSVDASSFLPEMRQQGMPRPAAMTARPASVSRPPNNVRPARGQQPQPRKQQRGAAGTPSARPDRADRSPGSGVGAHVDSFIGQHVKSHIGRQPGDAAKKDISDQVRSHLGEDKNKPLVPTAATTHGSAAAGDLLLALRSPQGVRQAILISEVLSKPKALRRP